MKAGDLFRRAFRRLEEAGIDGREAEILVHAAAGITRERLYRDDTDIPIDTVNLLDAMVGRRLAREPLAYITGTTGFLDLELGITPAVLIPRPETEWMVASIIAGCRDESFTPSRVLDVGTGSGCIALSLARAFPGALVIATDISPEALKVAQGNLGRNRLSGRVHLVVDAFLRALSPGFDLIVSNPPYVAAAERAHLDRDVRDFEPHSALFGGEDGLDFYREAIPAMARLLVPGGRVFLEIGADQGRQVPSLMEPWFPAVSLWRDVAGRDRVVAGTAAGSGDRTGKSSPGG